MFPLGTVVFPGIAIPLRVFEDRYQALLDRVLAEDRRFGTVLIERGFEVGGGDARFDVGTLLQVAAVEALPGGHRAVAVVGVERIRIREWLPDDPHPWAMAEPFPDEPEQGRPDIDEAHRLLVRVLALASELGADTAGFDTELPADPTAASQHLGALCPVTPLDAQRLLEAPGPVSRVKLAIELLTAQIDLLNARLAGT